MAGPEVALIVMGGSALLSAYGTYQQGKAENELYKAKAADTMVQARSQIIQARQQEIAHRQEGVRVLEQVKRNQATINARAAAGSLDPFSGSIGNLMTVNLDQGFQDFTMTRDSRFISQQNQNIIGGTARRQAEMYRRAGRQAQRSATFQALAGLGMSAAGMSGVGGPMPGGPMPGGPTPAGPASNAFHVPW